MATANHLHIGTREFWGQHPVSFTDHDAYQHCLVNGQTGTGKSEILKLLYAQLIQHGHGCTLIDLNGDLSKEVLNFIPPAMRDRVIFIDPTDTEHVLSINPFYRIPPDQRGLFADHFVHACESIWSDSWGERMSHYLEKIVTAVPHAPDKLRPTMLSINLMLSPNATYRKQVLKHIDDPELLRFFTDEFSELTPTKLKDVIMPIENKIGKVVSNQFVRNMLSPHKPAFQFKDAIANRSIVIVRLPKGTLGETPAKLLGSLIVSSVLNAAQQQDRLPPQQRVPHYLFIDEKHILPTKALTSAYSEMRKYKLGIFATTQYTDQMDQQEVKSMLGNIGTFIVLRSSSLDAKRFFDQIGLWKPHIYTDLAKGRAVVRLMREGQPDTPVQVDLLLAEYNLKQYDSTGNILNYVRERYTKPRAEVEQKYMRWIHKMIIDPAERRKQREKQKRDQEKSKQVVFVHQPPAAPPTHSRRTLKAKAEIKKIVDAAAKKHPSTKIRYPTLKTPTRRRKRKVKTNDNL